MAARLAHAMELARGGGVVVEVLEDVERAHHVEAAVGERQRSPTPSATTRWRVRADPSRWRTTAASDRAPTARPWRDSISDAPPVPQPTSRRRARAGSSCERARAAGRGCRGARDTTSASLRPRSRRRGRSRPSIQRRAKQHRRVGRPAERQRAASATAARRALLDGEPRRGGVDARRRCREVVVARCRRKPMAAKAAFMSGAPPGSRRAGGRRARARAPPRRAPGAELGALQMLEDGEGDHAVEEAVGERQSSARRPAPARAASRPGAPARSRSPGGSGSRSSAVELVATPRPASA